MYWLILNLNSGFIARGRTSTAIIQSFRLDLTMSVTNGKRDSLFYAASRDKLVIIVHFNTRFSHKLDRTQMEELTMSF